MFNWFDPSIEPAPHHDHPFDQLALVCSGTLRFDLDGEKYTVGSGQFLYIPAGVPHTAEVIGGERVLNIDIFSPIRQDYAYLTASQPDSST